MTLGCRTLADIEIGDPLVRAGDRAVLFHDAANRDPQVFDRPVARHESVFIAGPRSMPVRVRAAEGQTTFIDAPGIDAPALTDELTGLGPREAATLG